METPAAVAAREAILRSLAIAFFPVVEISLLAVSLLLLAFVAGRSMGRGDPPSPLRFAALCVFVLAGTGAFAAYWGFAHALFAFAFTIGLALSFVDPVVAICFLLANTLLRPWEVTGIQEMSIIPKTLGALATLSWVVHGVRSGKLALLFNWPSRLFLAFSGWVLFSAITSGNFADGLQGFANTMMIATILFILVANAPRDEADLRLIERTLVIAITGVIAHATLMTLFQDGSAIDRRLEGIGLTGNANDLAALIVQALPITVIPALASGKNIAGKFIALAVLPFLLAGLILAESRGAMLAVVVSTACYLVPRARNPRRAIFVTALCVPLLFGALAVMNMARKADDIQGSTESRFGYVVAGLRMAAHNPLTGVGFSNYPKLYESYSSGDFSYEWGQRTAHSTWVLALAETGIPGFVLLVALFVSTFKRAWRVRFSHPELFSALAGYGLAMSFLSHTYTFFPYLLFALVLAAAKGSVPAAKGGAS